MKDHLHGVCAVFNLKKMDEKNTNINYDKVICWEHPNYATTIIKNLDNNLLNSKIKNIPNIYLMILVL